MTSECVRKQKENVNTKELLRNILPKPPENGITGSSDRISHKGRFMKL